MSRESGATATCLKGEIGQCRAIEHWNVERDAAKKWQEAKNALEDETAQLIQKKENKK